MKNVRAAWILALAAGLALAPGCRDDRQRSDPPPPGEPLAKEASLKVVFQSRPEGIEFLVAGDLPADPGCRIRVRDAQGAILSERPPEHSGTLLAAPAGTRGPFVIEATVEDRVVASIALAP